MLEVHGDIVAPDVGGHGNDGSGIKLSNQVASGDTVQVWHDDVHQHKIVLRAGVHLVHRL